MQQNGTQSKCKHGSRLLVMDSKTDLFRVALSVHGGFKAVAEIDVNDLRLVDIVILMGIFASRTASTNAHAFEA